MTQLGADRGTGARAKLAEVEEAGRLFWLDLIAVPDRDAVSEYGVEARRFGPVDAMAVAGLPEHPHFNVILGAAQPEAVERGHLAGAVEWLRSLEIEHRVPVMPDLAGTAAAEDWLGRNGYERRRAAVRYLRDAAPPELPEPPGIEVDDFAADYGPFAHGFSRYALDAFRLPPCAEMFFESLPRRRWWHCYAAIDERELGIGAATMRLSGEIAWFGLAATFSGFRNKGAHLALLRRRIADAAAAGCHTLVAEVEEPLGDGAEPAAAARNLVRAGFGRGVVCEVWEPAGS